jgi:ATP-dependent Lhr-like helicase
VSAFLQRVDRGNRRSGICQVVAFRASEEDERMARALIDCARRGELDDAYEYDRPSVRFQQVLSLSWRATHQNRALSISALAKEAGTREHEPVIADMIDTGCLLDIRGAIVPSNHLLDLADRGGVHSQQGGAVVDQRTGDTRA